MVFSREVWDLRDGTPPNKEKPFQTRKNLSKQGKTFPNKKKHLQTRKNLSKQEKTPPNKKTAFQARKIPSKTRRTPFEQGKRLSSKGYLPIKCSLQVVGVFRQGKAVVSDGGYGVIGGGYCLLVWGDAKETKGERGGGSGVGSAPLVVRPLFPFGVSVILKI